MNTNDFSKFAKSNNITSTTFNDYINKGAISQFTNYVSPTITEERNMNVAQMDVFSRLMMERIIFMGDAIDDDVANIIQAQLLFLQYTDSEAPVMMYINSPGGYVQAGLGILDTMEYIKPIVGTLNTGTCASMAAVLLAAGENKHRKSLKHSRTMIHQPMGGASGQASDIQIIANEIIKTKKELYAILSDYTGQTPEKIETDSDRDYWMNAIEAKEYGMIDDILYKAE